MEGRKPKPTAVKKLEGNPGKRKLNAKEHITSDGSTFETDKGYQQQTPLVGIAHHGGKVPAPNVLRISASVSSAQSSEYLAKGGEGLRGMTVGR